MGKIQEGKDILTKIGIPRAQQNERSSLTLLAVVNIKKNDNWSAAEKRLIRIHDILVFIEKYYKKEYAENTRETIRRQTLHQFEQAGIVERNTDDPSRSTNSPNTVYNISKEALSVIVKYKTSSFKKELQDFILKKGKLIDRYEKRKTKEQLKLITLQGNTITFSPGKHNELQVNIIKELLPRFCSDAKLVYVGDTARKLLFREETLLSTLNIPITKHEKLPDVVLFNEKKNQLFLIEAVTSHGPVSPKRQVELKEVLKDCKSIRIYISAFPNFHGLKKHMDNIAWETEVWVADNPDHMIHFNGPKFFSAY